jgi:cytochrome c6
MKAARVAAIAVLFLEGTAAYCASPPGAELYKDNCSACHQPSGSGILGAFPALKGDPIANGDPRGAATLILNGRGGMPAFKDSLTDAELAAILTYVRSAWGNHAKAVSPADFSNVRVGDSAEKRLLSH